MKNIHGGDIYRNHVDIDFSVNVNPLGMPKAVAEALQKAVCACGEYPDITAEQLKSEVSTMLSVPKEYLLFGNGASELFLAIVHAIRPKKTMIPVPSFYGYEYAAEAAGGEIVYYPMKEEKQFCLGEDFLNFLKEWEVGEAGSKETIKTINGNGLIFLANPNNPTGMLLSKTYLQRLLYLCGEKGIYVVLDECFVEFCEGEASLLSEISGFENVILVRAFTKIFTIPGVRLGYLVCSNQTLLEKIARQLPEWNLSTFAQAAGCACARQSAFVKETVAYVRKERQFLEQKLEKMGFQVFPGEANFLMVYVPQAFGGKSYEKGCPIAPIKSIYESLLDKGILIRNCKNFRGLSEGYYRIAVKSREENEILLKRIEELCCAK